MFWIIYENIEIVWVISFNSKCQKTIYPRYKIMHKCINKCYIAMVGFQLRDYEDKSKDQSQFEKHICCRPYLLFLYSLYCLIETLCDLCYEFNKPHIRPLSILFVPGNLSKPLGLIENLLEFIKSCDK